MEQSTIGRRGERRETTVANHLGCDSLGDFLGPVLEHLKIGMAVRIDEARRYRQPATVDYTGVNGGIDKADHLNGRPGDQDVTRTGRRPRAVNHRSALENNSAHLNPDSDLTP